MNMLQVQIQVPEKCLKHKQKYFYIEDSMKEQFYTLKCDGIYSRFVKQVLILKCAYDMINASKHAPFKYFKRSAFKHLNDIINKMNCTNITYVKVHHVHVCSLKKFHGIFTFMFAVQNICTVGTYLYCVVTELRYICEGKLVCV